MEKTILLIGRNVVGATILALMLALNTSALAQSASSLTPRQQEVLEEVLAEFTDGRSLQVLRRLVDNKVKTDAVASLENNEVLPILSFGEEGAPVVVEFSDYQCGYCKRMFPVLQAENIQVKVVEFPVLGAISQTAAKWALAARAQGRYEEFHIALMNNKERLNEEILTAAAVTAGLDVEQLKIDSEGAEVAEQIRQNREIGRLLSVRGTPFMVIAGQTVPGAINTERLRTLLGIEPEPAQEEQQ